MPDRNWRWWDDAVCAEVSLPHEAWTERDGVMWGKGPLNRLAIRICQTCPVKAECLDDAMRFEGAGATGGHSTRDGIYGGVTPHQRELIHQRNAKKKGTA